jgi:hypothetical protein
MVRNKFKELIDNFSKFVSQWKFEWYSVLTFKDPVKQELGRKKLLQWIRRICVYENIQVAFIGVFNEFEHRQKILKTEPVLKELDDVYIPGHWHLMMFGRNRFGQTLSKVSIKMWAQDWHKRNCGDWIHWDNGARIRSDFNLTQKSRYMGKNLMVRNPDGSDLLIYNKKLLEKCRAKSFVT